MPDNLLYDIEEVSKVLDYFKPEGELFEVRIIKGKKDRAIVCSGYFTSKQTFFEALQNTPKQYRDYQKMTRTDWKGFNFYIIFNEINEDCYSYEQHDEFLWGCVTTKDEDIVTYKHLFLDCDPVRRPYISSTDEELESALQKKNEIIKYLSDFGFPEPYEAMSGNGAHAVYDVDLPNNEENKSLIEKIVKHLDQKFSDSKVKIDTSVYSPAQPMKLHGTLAQKGADTKKRPHRLSRVMHFPEERITVTKDILEKVAKLYQEPQEEVKTNTSKLKKKSRTISSNDFDVESWLNDHNIGIKSIESDGKGGTKYILNECPFDSSHKGKDAAVFKRADGTIGFNCFHDHCEKYGWKDLRLKFEPDAYDKKNDDKRIEEGYREHKSAGGEPIDLRQFHKWDKTGNPKGVHDWNIFRYLRDTENIFVMGGIPYIYEHGVYIPDSSSTKLKTMIRELMYNDFKTANNIKKIYELFLSDAGIHTESKDLYNFPDEWINFLNAFYDPVKKELIPHDPKYKAINQIPFSYDPDGDPGDEEVDKWIRFIAQDEEDREMLLQFLGYCLTGDIAQQKMLFLKGIEGTGKSTVIRIMTAMVGENNTANVTMQRLASDRFAAARLVGKTLNTCGDLGIKPIDDVAFMKNCLGDDGLEAETKGKDSYSFKNRAKIVYSANELPIIKNERTKGFYRKVLILKMNTPPEKRDMYYEQRLKKGLPHLIHLAVDALSRMYQSGHIVESKNSIDAVNEWWTDSDPVEAWLQAKIEKENDPRKYIKRDELFKNYIAYCDEMGIKEKCSNKGLYRALRNKGIKDDRVSSGDDKGCHAFFGISIKLEETTDNPDKLPFP